MRSSREVYGYSQPGSDNAELKSDQPGGIQRTAYGVHMYMYVKCAPLRFIIVLTIFSLENLLVE